MVGKILAHYEILEPLGAGGMGEVYRARDTKLDRDVAIKVLPEDFAADPERLARFEREAKLLASLNHANIAAIYGLEDEGDQRFIVMEVVEGETLADRIAGTKGIDVEDALNIARQVAEALGAAHENGVIHRDLKPANVIVAADGMAKVLDFGLAKAFAVDGSASDASPPLSHSPTMVAATQAGVILGTAAYMSPEQAKGKPLDKRTDIWSFGCLLYEMLVGQRPFGGEDVSETLAAILKDEPDLEALPPGTHLAIVRLLRRCLMKNARERLHDIADARLEIEEAFAAPAIDARQADRPLQAHRWQPLLPWTLTALFAVGAGAVAWSALQQADVRSPARLVVALPPGQELSLGEEIAISSIALSPDGRLLVYTATQPGGGATQLFRRPIDEFEAQPMVGTEGAQAPFFSPDGEWIGFFANGALWRVSVSGGFPLKICDASVLFSSASWGPDDAIIFSHLTFGLYKVSASGGTPELLTLPDAAAGEFRHFDPQILPGGRHVLFTINYDDGPRAAILSLASNEWDWVLPNAHGARYVPTGHLVYAQEGALMVVAFDLGRLRPSGSPIPTIERVPYLAGLGGAHFAVSDTGTLAYPPEDSGARDTTLVWVDRQNQQATPVVDGLAPYKTPRLSPDGSQIAVTITPDIWVIDVESGGRTKLTTEGYNLMPVWDPQRNGLTFSAVTGAAHFDLHFVPADRATEPEQLLARGGRQLPSAWSPDGNVLAFFETTPAGANIGILEGGSPSGFLSGPSNEDSPMFSPDGRWIAYVSDNTGKQEVYVKSYLEPGGSTPVSVNGGREPVWSRDGRELFYRQGEFLMVVLVETSDSDITFGPERVLLSGWPSRRYGGGSQYDVALDGNRFLMLQRPEATPSHINVVLDWFDELNRLVPAGGSP